MNQEIEGRRVKVLPVLASRCDLPGFLKGKLYADISTSKKFDTAFPRLLESLGVAAQIVKRASGKSQAGRPSNLGWVHDLERALTSSDENSLFEALKSVNSYDARPILRESRVIQQLLRAAEFSQPTHIRIRVLEILGGLEDPRFWYYLEPFLSDKNEYVVAKAVDSLADLGFSPAAEKIVSLLGSTESRTVRSACLRYFSRVSLTSEAEKLSLLAICRSLEDRIPPDPGLMLLITEALTNQVERESDEIINFVVDKLRAADSRNRLAALEALRQKGDELFALPRSRNALGNAILSCLEAEDYRVQASALILGLLMKHTLPQFKNNVAFWGRMETADHWTVYQILEELSVEYRLEVIFDVPGDCKRLANFLGKFDEELDELVEQALKEIARIECIEILAAKRVTVDGWTRKRIMFNMLKQEAWSPDFSLVLSGINADFSSKYEESALMLYALAKYKSGQIDLDELGNLLPLINGEVENLEYDEKKMILNELTVVRREIGAKHRRKVDQIIAAIQEN